MTLRNERELDNTKRKLRLLEESYEEARTDTEDDEHLREVEMESLKRLINQLKEEIARYQAHQPSSREAARS
jgi:flagellar biosynthesis chaperone FliJ